MAARFAGVILAGGRGERFGGPKALAQLPGGRTFLEACCRNLSEAGAAPVIATLPPEVEMAAPAGLTTVTLPESGLAMFDSLRLALERALESAEWTAAIVLPVDHPLVNIITIRTLAAADGPAAIPSFAGKHGHPVMLSRAVAERIVARDLPGPTLREVLKGVGTVDVFVDDPGITANCNTPDALTAALASVRG